MSNYNEEEYMTISIDDVPEWLQDSEKYRNCSEEEKLEIPSQFFIQNPIINWIDDFKNVIGAMEYWEVKRIPNSVFLFTIYHYSQGYQRVKEMFPNFSIWNKLDIFVSYIEELNLIMDMVNLSASSRTVYPLMLRLAKHGFVDCIEFCLSLFRSDYKEDKPETDYLLNSEIYIPIIKSNLNTKEKIKAMEKLQDLGFPPCHTAYIIDRNTESNPACLVWLVKNGAQVDSSTLKEAITSRLGNTIRFLLGIGIQLNEEMMEHACSENKIKVVKMFMERDCPCDRNSFFRAIENSNLEMVKILLSYIPCEANEEVIRSEEHSSELQSH